MIDFRCELKNTIIYIKIYTRDNLYNLDEARDLQPWSAVRLAKAAVDQNQVCLVLVGQTFQALGFETFQLP